MNVLRPSPRAVLWALAGMVALLTAAALAASERSDQRTPQQLPNVSRVASLRVPYFAPKRLSARMAAARRYAGRSASDRGSGSTTADVFNDDVFGLPQNEESVTACRTNPDIVLEGTNDYRGLIDPQGNFTGWHFSTNGGRSLRNEGLLPPVTLMSDPSREVPSGGDPVKVAGTTNAAGTSSGCAYLYAASLAYNPADPFGDANGIGVYRSTPSILATCPTEYPNSSNPACWPTRRLVAEAAPSHFLDKEWFDVGRSGANEVVWVTYSDFAIDQNAPLGFTGAEIFAVRCDRDLITCTAPIPISEDDVDVQFSDVTIADDGRVYVTWVDVQGELPGDPPFPVQEFIIKMRVAQPGSIAFGPERIVHHEQKPIPFGGFMHANDWRVATYPKNEVVPKGGGNRTFVVWDRCRYRPLDSICEEAEILLKWSDNDGMTWHGPREISADGDNYFPSIGWNQNVRHPELVFAWFTNRFDEPFHNAQDVEYRTLDPNRLRGPRPTRITRSSNESEADPLLGGFFIGDYIEVTAVGNRAWVGYNANYRKEQLLGPFGVEGIPVSQQDNYLARLSVSDDGDDDD
jgi:hypothetical protein